MKAFTTIFAVILAFSLISCFHDRASTQTGNVSHGTSQNDKKRVSYTFNGEFQSQGKWLRVLGQSNLKKGTKLTIQLNDKNLGELTVKRDGSFYTDFDGKDINEAGILAVVMIPTGQTDNLKKVYGSNGEYLAGKFCFNGTENGQKFTGLKVGMLVTQRMVSDPLNNEFGDNLFLSLDEIKQSQEELKQKDKNKGGS